MSKNIYQVYQTNPITTNQPDDLMYFGQYPYGIGNDAGMQYIDFAAQFGQPYTASALTRTNDTNVTLTLGGNPSTSLLQAVSLTMGWNGTLGVTRGGTGLSSINQGSLLYGSATNTLSELAKNSTSSRYLSNSGTSNNPAWSQVDLTNGVTGNLPVTNLNSGTGASATTYWDGSGNWSSPTGNIVSGTWTPSTLGVGTAGSPTYSSRTGYYTKCGNMVTVWFTISLSSWGGASGAIAFDGLPFSIDPLGATRGSGTVMRAGNMTNYQPMVLSGATGTQFRLMNGETYGGLAINVSDATASMTMTALFIYQTP